MEVDPVADKLLHHCHFQNDQNAIRSTGDGDCLFNSVSTLLVGDESLATELRYKTCLEMFLNGEKIKHHKDRPSFLILCGSYESALKACARPRQYACVWTILALSNIINVPMEILYPCVNGCKDLAFLKLNFKTSPEDPISDIPIKIMWTSTFTPKPNKTWTPNHFVPVVPSASTVSYSNQDINFSFQFAEKEKSTPTVKETIFIPSSPSPTRHKNPQAKSSRTTTAVFASPPSSPFSLPSPTVTPSSPEQLKRSWIMLSPSPPSSTFSSPLTGLNTPRKRSRAINDPLSPQKQRKRSRIMLSPLSSPSSLSTSNRYSILEGDEEGERKEFSLSDAEETPILRALPHNRFLTVDDAYKAVTDSGDSDLTDKIPRGQKNNVYAMLKMNSKRDSKYEFPDDCGVWGRAGTTVNSAYMLKDGKLKTVVYKKDAYCNERKIGGQRMFVPLEPQPAEDTIVKCHRYYTKLKSDNGYSKRVTIFTKLPPQIQAKQNIAIVEYQGIFQHPKTPHGNNKKTSEPYIRTDPQILREAATITTTNHQMPLKTSHQMLLDDSVNAPNAKQIRDKVFRDSKKNQGGNLKLTNIADEVLATISMCQNGENNIREVIVTPNRPPSVIVYSDEQLEDLKTNCIGTKGSVIGIDRTFNLGPCFVTTTTYKNRKLLKRETLENPIFLGPTLLHWDGETDSYYKFLCHLNSKLGFPSGLKVGSDEEKAIKKAIQQAFNNPVHLLCVKHLKDNVRRYLKDKEGCSTKDREFVVSSIFGPDGAINSDDSFSYDSKIADLEPILKKFPQFQRYFETRLKPLLDEHVFQPLQSGTVSEQWTNNNSESMNNRLKQSLNWKPHKLPDLISKINEISAFQINDLRRAIHGNGNYILEDTLQHHRVQPDVWVKMSQSEKRRKTWKLLSQKPIDAEKRQYIKSSRCSFQVRVIIL